MHIRTAEDLARALDSPLRPELLELLGKHADRLAEYPDFAFDELAEIIVVEAGESLDGIRSIMGPSIVTEGTADFTYPVELISQHDRYIEVVFILSDDGFGLILAIEIGDKTDAALLALCTRELQQYGSVAS